MKKKKYNVTIKATITKTLFIEAEDEDAAIWDAEETFNPYSEEAEDKYTQEVVLITELK